MIFDKLKEPKVLNIIIPLSAVAIISRTFPQFSYFYYLLPLLFLLTLYLGYKFILKDKALRNVLIIFFLFGLWCAATSFWSDYPLISLSRSGYFIFICIGAVVGGYLWQQINSGSLSFLLPANIIIVSLSLFSLITNIPAESWTGGNGNGFMGFAGHQNTLASAILFTLPSVISKIANGKRQTSKSNSESEKIRNPKSEIRNYFLYSLIFINLLILLLTYSRASILALVFGVIIFLILNKKWNTLIYSSIVVLLIFSLIWFSPSLKEKINELTKKDFPAFYSTREWMWVPSYKAALNGGLFGLGYGVSDPDIIVPGTGSYYDNERYIREKGNSFLALIEEVGVVGFILFLLPLGYLLKMYRAKSLEQRDTSSILHQPSSIIIAALAAFIIHSQFEAWMVGVGSIQLPIFFFYLGCMIPKNLLLTEVG